MARKHKGSDKPNRTTSLGSRSAPGKPKRDRPHTKHGDGGSSRGPAKGRRSSQFLRKSNIEAETERKTVVRASSGEARARRPLWLFISEPGLGTLHLKELKNRKVVRRNTRVKTMFLRNYDVIVLPDVQVVGSVTRSRLSLHTLECSVFGRDTVSEQQIDLLAEICKAEGIDRLASSVAGSTFDRKELTSWLRARLKQRGVNLSSTDSERIVWLIVVDQAYYIGVPRQNHHDAAARGAAGERSGALPSTIAAAMAFAGEIRPGDVVWDPMTGSGSLLAEADSAAKGIQLIGSDVDAAAVQIASQRIIGADFKIGRVQDIALGRKDVTLTLVNPPWDEQFTSEAGQEDILNAVISASLNFAAENWRGVILTPHGAALAAVADKIGGLRLTEVCKPTVRGLSVGMWRLDRA